MRVQPPPRCRTDPGISKSTRKSLFFIVVGFFRALAEQNIENSSVCICLFGAFVEQSENVNELAIEMFLLFSRAFVERIIESAKVLLICSGRTEQKQGVLEKACVFFNCYEFRAFAEPENASEQSPIVSPI